MRTNTYYGCSLMVVNLLTLPDSDADFVDKHLVHSVPSIGKGQRTTGAHSAFSRLGLLPKRKKNKRGDNEDNF